MTESENAKVLKGESLSCRQHKFKFAVLLYACERLKLKREFPEEFELMHVHLSTARLPSGGISHYFDVYVWKKRITPDPDATGEATAIFMLAKNVVWR